MRDAAPPSLTRRIGARVVDFVALVTLTAAVPTAVEIVVLEDMLHASPSAAIEAGEAAMVAFFLLGWPAYFAVLWSIGRGRTLGMMVMGTRLVSADGGPIPVHRAFVRLVLLPIGLASLLFGLVGTRDREGRGWHDMVARTRMRTSERT